LAAGLQMLDKGRTERAALGELIARLDHAIAATEANVHSLRERLIELDASANVAQSRDHARSHPVQRPTSLPTSPRPPGR
jgi:hypothetical protein